ncbi:MAG: Nif11-like leader peptide family RiPP precursor [Treponema sp.]|nr:Nif11-like leader peptide family RiPP precursor [Treponema sp.]
MAKENVEKFFEKVANDENLKKELSVAQAEAVVAVAKKAGIDFTTKELVEMMQAGAGELSDEELEGVAGGGVAFVTRHWSAYGVGELDPMIEIQRKKKNTNGFSYR